MWKTGTLVIWVVVVVLTVSEVMVWALNSIPDSFSDSALGYKQINTRGYNTPPLYISLFIVYSNSSLIKLGGHSDGKTWCGRENYISMQTCKTFVFCCKSFALPEKLCVRSESFSGEQMFCERIQKFYEKTQKSCEVIRGSEYVLNVLFWIQMCTNICNITKIQYWSIKYPISTNACY